MDIKSLIELFKMNPTDLSLCESILHHYKRRSSELEDLEYLLLNEDLEMYENVIKLVDFLYSTTEEIYRIVGMRDLLRGSQANKYGFGKSEVENDSVLLTLQNFITEDDLAYNVITKKYNLDIHFNLIYKKSRETYTFFFRFPLIREEATDRLVKEIIPVLQILLNGITNGDIHNTSDLYNFIANELPMTTILREQMFDETAILTKDSSYSNFMGNLNPYYKKSGISYRNVKCEHSYNEVYTSEQTYTLYKDHDLRSYLYIYENQTRVKNFYKLSDGQIEYEKTHNKLNLISITLGDYHVFHNYSNPTKSVKTIKGSGLRIYLNSYKITDEQHSYLQKNSIYLSASDVLRILEIRESQCIGNFSLCLSNMFGFMLKAGKYCDGETKSTKIFKITAHKTVGSNNRENSLRDWDAVGIYLEFESDEVTKISRNFYNNVLSNRGEKAIDLCYQFLFKSQDLYKRLFIGEIETGRSEYHQSEATYRYGEHSYYPMTSLELTSKLKLDRVLHRISHRKEIIEWENILKWDGYHRMYWLLQFKEWIQN